VINARDAMPKGGKLTLETLNVEVAEALTMGHRGVPPGRYVKLVVSDTGIGMDKDTQARMFEPFFTTKAKGMGTGLGLSTVFGIVRQSKGHIWVESELGRGTVFTLLFPVADGSASAAEGPRDRLSTLGGTETILLVEDEEQIRTVISRLLSQIGYRVLAAAGGDQAIRIAEQQPGKIDVLLTDVVMPQMSGAHLASALLSVRPEIKVLCMSGYTDEAVLKQGILDAGFAFIQKPLRPDDLARKLRDVIARGQVVPEALRAREGDGPRFALRQEGPGAR
jgi:two-component system cell cycle sensor histidine kinase/response regulator CckA